MAASYAFTDDLKAQLTCAICNDIFTDPRTLPCLHTFCLNCIKSWNEACQRERKRLRCPTCRAVVKIEGDDISKLPSSFTYNSLLQLFNVMKTDEYNQQQLPECVGCSKQRILVGFCPQCEGMICNECINQHKTVKPLIKTHQATLWSEFKTQNVNSYINNQTICKEKYHQKCRLDYYCITCKKCICQKCGTTAHSSHDKVSIEEAAEDAKNLIRKEKDRLNELLLGYKKELKLSNENMTRIQSEVDTTKAKVRNDTQAMMKILQDHQNALIATLDGLLAEQITANEDEKKDINANIQQVTELKHQCETTEEKNLEKFILESYENLLEVCKATAQNKSILSTKPVERNTRIYFIPNPEAIAMMRKLKLGEVLESVTDPYRFFMESSPAERERQQFMQALERQRRAEEEARLREELRKEEERLMSLELQAKSIAKRQDLFDYQFGSKIGSASFRGLDISDVDKLRIGVFGPIGSGKSCFISTCERVVRNEDKGSSPIATSVTEGTIVLEDFLSDMFFRLVDTRGFFNYDANEEREFNDILYGRLQPGDFIRREEDEPEFDVIYTDAPFSDWIHGIILVVKANDPRLKQGALRDYLNPVRQILRSKDISPVTVVTHRDTLKTQKECEDALELASAATGASRSRTFLVDNYCPDNPGPDVNTELKIFDILHFAILTAERNIKIEKQHERKREEDQMVAAMENASMGSPSRFYNASIEMFLNLLQCKYKWKEKDIKKVLSKLEEEDIKTMGMLADNWSDAKPMFPFEMHSSIEKHLTNMNMI